MGAKRTQKPTNLELLVKKAVLEAVGKLMQDFAPIKPPAIPPAANNKELMAKLLAEGRSDDEILDVFKDHYAREGKTDEEWIEARVRIYQRLAQRKQRHRSRRRKARHSHAA